MMDSIYLGDGLNVEYDGKAVVLTFKDGNVIRLHSMLFGSLLMHGIELNEKYDHAFNVGFKTDLVTMRRKD
jgi:hypothetical protein